MAAGSYSFDGSDDRISYADSAAMDALNLTKYLILVWVRPGSGGNNNGRIFGRAATSSGGPVGHMQIALGYMGNGTRVENFSARQKCVTTAGVQACANNAVPNTTWTMIGAHYDEDASGSRLRTFVNGAVDSSGASISANGASDDESDEGVSIGNSFAGDRAAQGQFVYYGIWDVSSLSNTEINTLVSDFYNSGTGTADVPRQDLLVEFLRLDADGATTGDKSVLTSPTVTGAAFTASNAPPVEYNPLGAPPQVILPDADIATTGWASTPLFSKLNDESDASVVTGTLS